MTVKPRMPVNTSGDVLCAIEIIEQMTRIFMELLDAYRQEKTESCHRAKLRKEMSHWQMLRNNYHDYVDKNAAENNDFLKILASKSTNVDIILQRLEKVADSKYAMQ